MNSSVFTLVLESIKIDLVRFGNEFFSQLPTDEDSILSYFQSYLNIEADKIYRTAIEKYAEVGSYTPLYAFSCFTEKYPFSSSVDFRRSLVPFMDDITKVDWNNPYVPIAIRFIYFYIYTDVAMALTKCSKEKEPLADLIEMLIALVMDSEDAEICRKMNLILVARFSKVIAWISLYTKDFPMFSLAKKQVKPDQSEYEKHMMSILLQDVEYDDLPSDDRDMEFLKMLLAEYQKTKDSRASRIAFASFIQNLIGQWMVKSPLLRKSPVIIDFFMEASKYSSSIDADLGSFRILAICATLADSERFRLDRSNFILNTLFTIFGGMKGCSWMLKALIASLAGGNVVTEARIKCDGLVPVTNIPDNLLEMILNWVKQEISSFRIQQEELEILFMQIAKINQTFFTTKFLPELLRPDMMCFCTQALGNSLYRMLQQRSSPELEEQACAACLVYLKRQKVTPESVRTVHNSPMIESDTISVDIDQWKCELEMGSSNWPFSQKGQERLTCLEKPSHGFLSKFLLMAEYLASHSMIIEYVCRMVVSGSNDVSEMATHVLCKIATKHCKPILENLAQMIIDNYMYAAPLFTWIDSLISVLDVLQQNEIAIPEEVYDKLAIVCCICATAQPINTRMMFRKLIELTKNIPFAKFVMENEDKISELAMRNVITMSSPTTIIEKHHFDRVSFISVIASSYTTLMYFYVAALGRFMAESPFKNLLKNVLTTFSNGVLALVLPTLDDISKIVTHLKTAFKGEEVTLHGILSCASPKVIAYLMENEWTKQNELAALVYAARMNPVLRDKEPVRKFCRNMEQFIRRMGVVDVAKGIIDNSRLAKFSTILFNYSLACAKIFRDLTQYDKKPEYYDVKHPSVPKNMGISDFDFWFTLTTMNPSLDPAMSKFEYRLEVAVTHAFVSFVGMSEVPNNKITIFIDHIKRIGKMDPDMMRFLWNQSWDTNYLYQAKYNSLFFQGIADSFNDSSTFLERIKTIEVKANEKSRFIFENFGKFLAICFRYLLSKNITERTKALNLLKSITISTALFFHPYHKVAEFIREIDALRITKQQLDSVLRKSMKQLNRRYQQMLQFCGEQFVGECIEYSRNKHENALKLNDDKLALRMLDFAVPWVQIRKPLDIRRLGVFIGCSGRFRLYTILEFVELLMNVKPEYQSSKSMIKIYNIFLNDEELLNFLLLAAVELAMYKRVPMTTLSYIYLEKPDAVMERFVQCLSIEGFNYFSLYKGEQEYQTLVSTIEKVFHETDVDKSWLKTSMVFSEANKNYIESHHTICQWAFCCGDLEIAVRAANSLHGSVLTPDEAHCAFRCLWIISRTLWFNSKNNKIAMNIPDFYTCCDYICSLIQLLTLSGTVDDDLIKIIPAYLQCGQLSVFQTALGALFDIVRREKFTKGIQTSLLDRCNFYCFNADTLAQFFAFVSYVIEHDMIDLLGSVHTVVFMLAPFIWKQKNTPLAGIIKPWINDSLHKVIDEFVDDSDPKNIFHTFAQAFMGELPQHAGSFLISYFTAVIKNGDAKQATAAYYLSALLVQCGIIPLESPEISLICSIAIFENDSVKIDPIHFFMETVVLANQGMNFTLVTISDDKVFPDIKNVMNCDTNLTADASFDNVKNFPPLVLVNNEMRFVEFQEELAAQMKSFDFRPFSEWSRFIEAAKKACPSMDSNEICSIEEMIANISA